MIHHNSAQVDFFNWRENEEFLDFLTLEFDFKDASPASRQHVLTLIPIAVAENRLLGSVTEIVLREAIEAWNRPPRHHHFTESDGKWKYIGATEEGVRIAPHLDNTSFFTSFGIAKRVMQPGAYCRSPREEIRPAPQKRVDLLGG